MIYIDHYVLHIYIVHLDIVDYLFLSSTMYFTDHSLLSNRCFYLPTINVRLKKDSVTVHYLNNARCLFWPRQEKNNALDNRIDNQQ